MSFHIPCWSCAAPRSLKFVSIGTFNSQFLQEKTGRALLSATTASVPLDPIDLDLDPLDQGNYQAPGFPHSFSFGLWSSLTHLLVWGIDGGSEMPSLSFEES